MLFVSLRRGLSVAIDFNAWGGTVQGSHFAAGRKADGMSSRGAHPLFGFKFVNFNHFIWPMINAPPAARAKPRWVRARCKCRCARARAMRG